MPATPLDATDVALPLFQPGEVLDGEAFALSSHARAREAIEFGLLIRDFGFNIFVLGETNSGRMTATLDFVNTFVAEMPPANDIVYLNNFARPHRPKPYGLPAGVGRKFRDHMTAFVPKLREAFVQAFGGKDYEREITTRRELMQKELSSQLDALKTEARADGLDIVQTEHGMMVVAKGPEGEPVALDTFPPQERKKLEAAAKQLSERLFEFNRSAAKLNVEFMSEAADLNHQVADAAVGHLIDDLETEYSGYEGLRRWIVELRADILENLQLFRPQSGGDGSHVGESAESRYAVNLFVDNGDEDSPGVVLEPNPTYENLFGRIEYRPVAGLLETDFSMMRAGALHRANGGILLLRAEALARNPSSWELLKGALRDREFRLEELSRAGAVPIAGAPTPKPVR
ncbi:MAG: ATP-binding protein, partial [Pirellulaceae bacterium]|nr:ATP-binding protein [Pirellulaceae bacterium]